MVGLSFRNRILLALLLLGALPTGVAVIGWTLSLRRGTAVAGQATIEQVAASGRILLQAIDTTRLSPAERSARDRHRIVLNDALGLARRAVVYSRYRTIGWSLVVLFVGSLLVYLSIVFGRNLSRQLSQPIEELIGWTKHIRRQETLPDHTARGGAPEFADLRIALREMAEGLQQARSAELEAERLRAFREVARRVAHEMKNPLTPVRFALSQLERTVSPAQVESLEVLRAETSRLEQMAREFANLGRLPEGPSAEVDLAELLEEILRTSLPPEMTWTLHREPSTPNVLGHYDPLRRAFGNLIRNGAEASGGVGPIDVGVRPRGQGVVVSIMDHGPGIPLAQRRRIFEPYFTNKPDGTGLGLAIVKQAIDLHRGRVDVLETIGGGATFEVWIPLDARREPEGGPEPTDNQAYLESDGTQHPDRRIADRRRTPR